MSLYIVIRLLAHLQIFMDFRIPTLYNNEKGRDCFVDRVERVKKVYRIEWRDYK